MSLSTRLRALVQAIGADIKSIASRIADNGLGSEGGVLVSPDSHSKTGFFQTDGSSADENFNLVGFSFINLRRTSTTGWELGCIAGGSAGNNIPRIFARRTSGIAHDWGLSVELATLGATGNTVRLGPDDVSGRAALKLGTSSVLNAQSSVSDTSSNVLMRTGAGGIMGYSTDISDAAADTLRGGLWRATAASNPLGLTGYLVNVPRSQNYSGQILFSETGRLTTRTKNNGVWQAPVEYFSALNQLGIGPSPETARATIQSSIMPAYTLATLPSAVANTNMIAVVTDLSSGREPCISDGASWLKLSDKAVAA